MNEIEMNKCEYVDSVNIQIIFKKMNKKDPITEYMVTNNYLFCSFIETILRLNWETEVPSLFIFYRLYMNLPFSVEIQKSQLWMECYLPILATVIFCLSNRHKTYSKRSCTVSTCRSCETYRQKCSKVYETISRSLVHFTIWCISSCCINRH